MKTLILESKFILKPNICVKLVLEQIDPFTARQKSTGHSASSRRGRSTGSSQSQRKYIDIQ
jgi:hypothetical protein